MLGVVTAPGSSMEETMRIGGQISKAPLANPNIATVEVQVGRAELGEAHGGRTKASFTSS